MEDYLPVTMVPYLQFPDLDLDQPRCSRPRAGTMASGQDPACLPWFILVRTTTSTAGTGLRTRTIKCSMLNMLKR